MVTVATARANIIAQVVDGTPSSITPPKLRTLLTDIIDSIISSVPVSKLDATAAPTANDDISNTSSNGIFTVGSFWIDTAANVAYRCVDSSTGAAIWIVTTLSTDDLGALAVLNTVDTAQIANNAVTLVKIASAIKSGVDAKLITGTAGSSGNLMKWNADGDAVDGPSSAKPTTQFFETSGTWTRPSGCLAVAITVTGGGGGGGGTASVDTFGCGGGGAGGSALDRLDVASIASSTITIGSGGTGSTTGTGNAGGLSSWADGTNTITGLGGVGGELGLGGVAGSASGGYAAVSGGNGGVGQYPIVAASAGGSGGNGGASLWGGGGQGGLGQVGAIHGASALTYGAGGGGGNGEGGNGGNGFKGCVIVWEFY